MINIKENEKLSIMNHSCAHLLAQAVKHLYPNALFWVGPVIEEGFYYDIDLGDIKITEEDIVKMESVLSTIKPMSELIHEGKTPEQIILETFDDAKILSTQDIKFRCHCSKDGLKGAVLATLSKDEIKEMIEEDHGCEITCDWCNTHYEFSEEELKELSNENR